MLSFFYCATTFSWPSIEMDGFMYVCMYLLLCRLLLVGPVLKWLALFITVPTTCSRPSIEMVGFIYLFIYVCMYFSVFTPLTRPLYIIRSNLACSSVSSV